MPRATLAPHQAPYVLRESETYMRALILAFALAACTQPAPAEAPPPPQTDLAQDIRADLERIDRELGAEGIVAAGLNETANLGGGLTVTPLEVLEDSRCPANVDCVWAGQVRLRVNISGAEAELISDQPLTTPSGAVVLAVVRPYPFQEWPEEELPIPPYRFGFRRG
ncbi:MAG: hypothetical protein DCF16_03825 [Alphaproteobacteria bacterium]|nr:MAG: hypothetical protein DCF16_03825 [Alphaproteobacteria bacterium]